MKRSTLIRRGLAVAIVAAVVAFFVGYNSGGSDPTEVSAPSSTTEATSAQPEVTTSVPTTTSQPTPTTTAPSKQARPPVEKPAINPISQTRGLFVDFDSAAARWAKAHPTDPRTPAIVDRIVRQPMARWVGGEGDTHAWVKNYVTAAASQQQLPVVVPYNIPLRDCGNHSAGGAQSMANYQNWINQVAAGIGNNPAIVILEPDSLIHLSCLDPVRKQERLRLLSDAVTTLAQRAPATWTYLDGGDGRFNPAPAVAQRLIEAGVTAARGFAVNVSNFNTTTEATNFARQVQTILLARTGTMVGYIIDVSRNGNGSNGEWCNPAGRKIGPPPSAGTTPFAADAHLWIKQPGVSDGNCGIAQNTPSGVFSPELALKLVQG